MPAYSIGDEDGVGDGDGDGDEDGDGDDDGMGLVIRQSHSYRSWKGESDDDGAVAELRS